MEYRTLSASGLRVSTRGSGGRSQLLQYRRRVLGRRIGDRSRRGARGQAETGRPVPQLALNWLLQRPGASTVLVGARNAAQLEQNLGRPGGRSCRRR